jgi:hypothetical protein
MFYWPLHGFYLSESVGVAAAISEFLLQSVDDTIRVFPCWPKDKDARFKNLRAQGGFLVSAEQKGGKVTLLEITPTVNGRLRLVDPWTGKISEHAAVAGKTLSFAPQQVLKPDTQRRYVSTFNSQRPDDTTEGLPADGSITVIGNDQAAAWMEQNVPRFECSDKDIEETYHFRWWTYRKHIKKTPDGFVVTEFLPKVNWSGKHNTINCPVGHHLYEGRWIRNPKVINDYTQFHFGKGGDPGGVSKVYSQWIADGIYASYLVHPDKPFITGLLETLIKNHEAWKQGDPAGGPWQASRLLDNALYWQIDSWEGQEFSIGGTGIRPPMNAYRYGDAMAIARIADMAGKKDVADHYRNEARHLRDAFQVCLWDSEAKFFKVMRHARAPMNQYDNSAAEDCAPGNLVKVREIFGYVPWYFNVPEDGRGFEQAWSQLTDPNGFLGSYGPSVTERRHPKFFHGGQLLFRQLPPGDPRNAKNKGRDGPNGNWSRRPGPASPAMTSRRCRCGDTPTSRTRKVMEQKIAAAADHGIDAFIFDWYYYNDGPFLDRPIDIGFLKAENNARLKFAFMWANHDWLEIQPYKRGTDAEAALSRRRDAGGLRQDRRPRDPVLLPASVLLADRRPALLLVLRPDQTAGQLRQRVEATRAALDAFRAKAVAAGLPGLHLNAVVWGRPILPGEEKPADAVKLVKDLGFDSVTSYVWIHHVPLPKLQTDYNEVRDNYFGTGTKRSGSSACRITRT